MIEVNWTLIFLLILLLVSADKIITYYNIMAVEKNFPDIDPFSIERNPLAKKFFQNFGLLWGNILYSILSLLTFLLALALIKWTLSLFGVQNSLSIALWVMVILYGMAIANNLFFLFKFNRWIP